MSTYEKRMRETQLQSASMRRRSVVQMQGNSATVENWPFAKRVRKTVRNALEDSGSSLGAKIFRRTTTTLIIASVLVLCLRELIASQARLTAVLNKLVAPGAEGTGGTKSAPPPPSAH